jgi:predicted porin
MDIKAGTLRIACMASLGLAAAAAHAQSSVTLYGVADAAVRYLTGANKNDDSQFSLANGAISQSRWGLRGREDLGGGLYAQFKLESGFNLPNGASSSSGVLFNRYASVGIGSNTYGLLTLGQQNNPTYEFLIDGWDPLTVGNYLQNEWVPVAFSNTLHGGNNMAMYTYTRGQLIARAAYSFGGVAGSFSTGSLRSVAVAYGPAPFGIQVGYVQSENASNLRQTSYNVQLRYDYNGGELFLGYYNSNDQTGSVEAFLSGSAPTPSTTNPRKDNAMVAGATYSLTPAIKFSVAGYYDWASNVLGRSGDAGDGRRYTLVGLAEYYFSGRTSLYATVDFNRMSGATRIEAPNGSDQLGVAIGLRSRF